MHSSNFSSSDGSTEDLFRDSIDSCDNDITEKVGPGRPEDGLHVCVPPGGRGKRASSYLGAWEAETLSLLLMRWG